MPTTNLKVQDDLSSTTESVNKNSSSSLSPLPQGVETKQDSFKNCKKRSPAGDTLLNFEGKNVDVSLILPSGFQGQTSKVTSVKTDNRQELVEAAKENSELNDDEVFLAYADIGKSSDTNEIKKSDIPEGYENNVNGMNQDFEVSEIKAIVSENGDINISDDDEENQVVRNLFKKCVVRRKVDDRNSRCFVTDKDENELVYNDKETEDFAKLFKKCVVKQKREGSIKVEIENNVLDEEIEIGACVLLFKGCHDENSLDHSDTDNGFEPDSVKKLELKKFEKKHDTVNKWLPSCAITKEPTKGNIKKIFSADPIETNKGKITFVKNLGLDEIEVDKAGCDEEFGNAALATKREASGFKQFFFRYANKDVSPNNTVKKVRNDLWGNATEPDATNAVKKNLRSSFKSTFLSCAIQKKEKKRVVEVEPKPTTSSAAASANDGVRASGSGTQGGGSRMAKDNGPHASYWCIGL